MSFTYTTEQAAAIATRWNDLANDDNQISAGDVHHLFGDSADYDLATDGETLVELRGTQSATGIPTTFHVTRADVDAPKYKYEDLPPRVAELQRRLESRENELAAIRGQREDTSAALVALLRPEIERMVEDILSTADKSSDIRDEVREMIADGDIVVSLDVM
jgi:hypothetical protein